MAFVRGSGMVAAKTSHVVAVGTYDIFSWIFGPQIRPGLAGRLDKRPNGLGHRVLRTNRGGENEGRKEKGTKEGTVEGKKGSSAADTREQELLNNLDAGSRLYAWYRCHLGGSGSLGLPFSFGDGVEAFGKERHEMGLVAAKKSESPKAEVHSPRSGEESH